MGSLPASVATVPPTTIRVGRERLFIQQFTPDARAALPRPLEPRPAVNASLAGVPPPLRSRIGRNLRGGAFPYPRFVGGDGRFTLRELNIVELENPRWRVAICPDLGGRVLRIHDRRAGRELLLQPPRLARDVIGIAGAWFVGGVEFNAFRYGHNVHGQSAIGLRRVRLPDGRDAVTFGACDEQSGCRWRVILALGQTQVLLRVEMENLSDEPQPDYWWTTIAVPAHRHTRLLAAPGPVLHHGRFRTGFQHDRWPRLHGRDWSRWCEHHEIAEAYFHAYDRAFFGCVDESRGFAFVHQADPAVCRGRKFWTLGAGRDNVIWCDRLLEPAATSYLELQSGLHPLQPECGLLTPGERRAWTESIASLSLEAAGAVDGDDYTALFARFVTTATAELQAEYRAHAGEAAWTGAEQEALAAADPRVELSVRILTAPETISADEANAAAAAGWVAGAAWRRKLAGLDATGEPSRWRRLAAAAAALDAGDVDAAVSELAALATGDDAVAGWSSYLLGLYRSDSALLERAVELLPDRAETWLALDRALAESRQHGQRAGLWTRMPPGLHTRPEVRVARAAGALASGDWSAARTWLREPLPALPADGPAAWLIFRETFVAEAAAHWRAGRIDAAACALAEGGQPAPQFGLDRDEAGWGGDLIYYRWRLAVDHGRAFEATLLLEQGLAIEAYAGSVAAAYLARLAHEAGHPAASERLRALQDWDEDAGPGGRAFSPLRGAVIAATVSGDMTGWEQLLHDPLHGLRAQLEFELRNQARAQTAARAGEENMP